MSVEEFVARTLKLVEKERDAEINETRALTEQLPAKELQRRGVCLLKLRLQERCVGLFGRTVATFQPFWPSADLPAHKLTPGDIVGVSPVKEEVQQGSVLSGIVSKVLPNAVQLAFEESQDVFSLDDEVQYKLTKLANDVTYRRLKRALKDLNQYSTGPAARLINVCFGLSALTPPDIIKDVKWINTSLDKSQQEAVRFALAQPELAVIHGPPGTGKTTTVVEIILQSVRQGLKVLALAPSNVAVDNLVERLSVQHKRIVRIGHPARLLPQTQRFSLDAMVSVSDQTSLAADARRDLEKKMSELKRSRGGRADIRTEMKQLRREVREREEAATRDILVRADVVLVTLTSAAPDSVLKLLDDNHFHLVVIDECSQALEAACWMGLMHGSRCVLAGDPHQLPPTILSKEAQEEGLSVTLMERVMAEYGDKAVRMLTVQYRMHQHIMLWSSQQLYGGRLEAHPSVSGHLLNDLPGVEDCPETETALLLVDTSGCHLSELDLPQEVSKGNEGEADIVAAHVQQLITAGVSPADIAVIAPYNLQVELLRQRLSTEYPALEVKSVDGFQGREKEAVVISFVRSNERREVGFLAEKRRINVAVTRARRHLAVVCDTDTVGSDEFLKSLIDYMSATGQVWSAQEFIQDGRVKECSSRPEILENLMDRGKQQDRQKEKSGKRDKKSGRTKSANAKQQNQKAEPQVKAQSRGACQDKQTPMLVSTEDKMVMYQKELEEFLADQARTTMTFPSTLTSHDRMVIHEVAEKLGLLHTSSGKDKDRHIVVSKPAAASLSADDVPTDGAGAEGGVIVSSEDTRPHLEAEKNNAVSKPAESVSGISALSEQSASLESAEESTPAAAAAADITEMLEASAGYRGDTRTGAEAAEKDKDEFVRCKMCSQNVLSTNQQVHEAHCSRLKRQQPQPPPAPVTQSGNKKGKKKPKPKPCDQVRQASAALQKVSDDDFDALIAAVTELDSKCSFKKCKTLTNTLGRNCVHCGRRFCLQHLMPEVHGCGDAARADARRTIVKEGVLYQGSGVPNKHPNPDRRAQLQHKLNKKLDTMAEQRAKKDPKKNDNTTS